MNCDSASSAGRKSSYDALTSLLGVEGALRLLPQGSTPKAHIVLKRDYSKGEGKSDQASTVARFSFIAGKKFTINKGQPLLFAVACPTDRDGKTLVGNDNTFVLEADIKGSSEDNSLEDTSRLLEQEDNKRSENIECLPPKARKSLVRKKAYASYIENEPPLSLGFPGYPLNPTTPRVYSTASVQTDLFSVSEPPSLTPTLTPSSLPAISLLVDAEKSPFQLPSPVSADHAQESISDALGGEETDDSSRAERSLSPMDLSSADSTPNTSPVPVIIELPKDFSSQPLEDEDSPVTPVVSSSPEELVTDTSLTSPVLATTGPDSTATAEASQTLDGCLNEDILKAENSAASGGNEPIKELKETIPSGPRAMQAPRPSIQPSSSRFIETSPTIPAGRPAFPTPIPNRQSGAVVKVNESLNDSQPPEPKALAYISAGSTSNPLGIRPSSVLTSSTHVPQKSVPTGPRSLTASMAPKKPVIVGSQWSAVRGSSSGSQTSNGSFSTTSNSSSLTTLPPSPVIPPIHKPAPSFVRATLSQILPYASPSPPPPPESEPPPPPPPPPGWYDPIPSRWKRITDVDDSQPGTILKSTGVAPGSNGNPSNIKNALKPAASPNILETSLKRHHDKIKDPGGPNQQSDASQEQPSKKARTTPQKASTSASETPLAFAVKREVSTASAVIPKATTTNVVAQKLPTPRTHPLPPKPTTTGSSYRPPPPKRERSPELPEPKRPSPRTDWPPTFPSAEARLQNSVPGADISVQKIIFNTDGSQIALICGDQTLRIWENKLAAAETARLTHNSSITSACWIGNIGVMTLCADGMISTWTRNGKEWKFAKLFRVHNGGTGSSSGDTPLCLAYENDRIAVSMPSGVKVWLLISGTWQQQREIARSGVTVIKFVQDGNALIGGCRDGVLWYCEVPNGTLRVHTFLPKTVITSIDVHPSGLYLLVGQQGGEANLITLRPNECKGSVERVYTSAKLQSMTTLGFPAVFATNGQAVLYGTVNGCALVWDRKKGAIVYGLKHPEDDPILSAATFDGRPGGVDGWMITGTKKGRLFWWPRPVAAAPTNHGANGQGTSSS